MFTSRASLWTQLDFVNADKTRTYIRRSRSYPLKFRFGYDEVLRDAFTLVIPHIHRLQCLTIEADALPSVIRHFYRHAPPLEKLHVDIGPHQDQILDGALFKNLSRLRELHLCGVSSHLSWKNLANLQVVDLYSRCRGYRTTQLLDFFESAPLLHTVSFVYPTADSSDAPPERIVPLRHLRVLNISTKSSHTILLRHLHIPIGASLVSAFSFHEEESPFLEYLPEGFLNPNYLSHITTINLYLCTTRKYVQLSGPSGSLRVSTRWAGLEDSIPKTMDHQILLSLGHPVLSTIQRLSIISSNHPTEFEEHSIFQIFSSMNNLRSLALTYDWDEPFVRVLDPEENQSNLVPCLHMEDLVVRSTRWPRKAYLPLIRMAKNRAARGKKLSLVTVVSFDDSSPSKEMFELEEYVTHMEYRAQKEEPEWDEAWR